MRYGESVDEKFNALDNVVVFIDGTVIEIARPTLKTATSARFATVIHGIMYSSFKQLLPLMIFVLICRDQRWTDSMIC